VPRICPVRVWCVYLVSVLSECGVWFFCLFPSEPQFIRSPGNVTSSLGKPVKVVCTLQGWGGEDPPDVVWQRDGQPLEYADTNQIQVPVASRSWMVISTLRIEKVQLPDMGSYRCAVMSEGHQTLSVAGHIHLEGLPHFSVEPQHQSVVANVSLSLHCVAHGPPEPVRVIWLQDGAPLNSLQDHVALCVFLFSPQGLNRTSTFSCEAHNRKGVATSGSGTITVLPSQPQRVRAVDVTNSSLLLSWEPGFGGVYPITHCTIQRTSVSGVDHMIHNQNVNIPPASHLIGDLEPNSGYAVRLACHTTQGVSDWTHWATLHTAEGGRTTPLINPPPNTHTQTDTHKQTHIHTDTHRHTHTTPTPYNNPSSTASLETLSFSSRNHMTDPPPPPSPPPDPSYQPLFSWHWWYVVMAIAVAVALAVLMAVYVAKLRRKETRFGEVFEPMMESGELVVRYRARRTYSRRTTEATLNTLGISDELKHKLQDVMVDRHKLTLGKTLGEGEFGSVMEGALTHEESVLKVAVKTMKIAICTRTEMEDFLTEAACMKEFDHQNVMRLLGVCLQTVESEGYPSPVVILPFMKHGDLHSYLLYSRLGDCPVYLPSQMLVKFMVDIAKGMEYLSRNNFIHRDLAARNCMLNENMNVCVADFGLSKKIYNGDYYRQGRISKMPVKWIAIESLADRVYTTKSDVWSFGVTMWEIASRGQTPYPGVENSEIYDYLRQGNRLKQPPDCLDSIYSLMFSCWFLSPKDRPLFETLRGELQKALEDLPDSQDPDEILYVNMEESMELGAVGGRDPAGGLKGLDSVAMVEVHHTHPSRYVLCPQHDTNRLLSDSLESLNLVSSSSATLPLGTTLQPSGCSTPTSTAEVQEDGEGPGRYPGSDEGLYAHHCHRVNTDWSIPSELYNPSCWYSLSVLTDRLDNTI
uniref:receptor protein-tyrosine kinase n=1 Tax=Oncorhynchus tshawytscha TaxID=74940 RepID=A0AAZ3NVC0_ONCTS